MNILRAIVALVAAASVCHGATSDATVSVREYKRGEAHTCEFAIVEVDGHRLKTPQAQVRFPPGRHALTVQVTFLWGGSRATAKVTSADASLVQKFEPQHYIVDGQLSPTGALKLSVKYKDKRHGELRSQKQNP